MGTAKSEDGGSPNRLWGGRFTETSAPAMDRLNRSLPVDWRMWREDLLGSRAWATGLAAAEVISQSDSTAILAGLDQVWRRLELWNEEEWAGAPDEDIHSLVERLLYEEAGDVAGKLHTGRSRNDQVATDTRLWALGAISRLDAAVRAVQRALLEQSTRHADTVMPAYTHLQRAQPVSAAHWLLSHAWPLVRDRERLAQLHSRIAVLPLGSGAIAGCPFAVDRVLLQETLGFESLSENSIDAVADRDWIAELLFVLAMVGVHLSKLAEDLILFGSSEYGFVRFSDQYSTGSSLMPQKRNPDAMELARAKSGRLIGELTGVLTVLKGLPSGYNKDLQEDKDAMFGAIDLVEALLPAVAGTVQTMEIDVERCAAAVDPAMLATDVADFLVRRGVPFREAHAVVGGLVRAAEERCCAIDQLPREVWSQFSDHFKDAVPAELFDPRVSIAARCGRGGTSTDAVKDQAARLRALL